MLLLQATRATHTPARSPIRNPYRALVEQEQLQQEQLQQQYWRQCLQLQQFERNRAAMLSRPDHNRPGPGRGTNDHMPYVDQYARDALVDAGEVWYKCHLRHNGVDCLQVHELLACTAISLMT